MLSAGVVACTIGVTVLSGTTPAATVGCSVVGQLTGNESLMLFSKAMPTTPMAQHTTANAASVNNAQLDPPLFFGAGGAGATGTMAAAFAGDLAVAGFVTGFWAGFCADCAAA